MNSGNLFERKEKSNRSTQALESEPWGTLRVSVSCGGENYCLAIAIDAEALRNVSPWPPAKNANVEFRTVECSASGSR